MTHDESGRLELLRSGPCVPARYIQEYYGLNWPLPEKADDDFRQQMKSRPARYACQAEECPRYQVEAFLQNNRLMTKKLSAARLGMKEESFTLLLASLPRLGLSRPYEVYPTLILETLRDDLTQNLPDFRYRTVGDHDSHCRRLHQALHDSLGLKIIAEYCHTSIELGEQPPHYAKTIDNITLSPLSVAHQVWLDFGKPISLPADLCSKLFYADNRDALSGCLAGLGEPDGMARYFRQPTDQLHG